MRMTHNILDDLSQLVTEIGTARQKFRSEAMRQPHCSSISESLQQLLVCELQMQRITSELQRSKITIIEESFDVPQLKAEAL